MRDTARMSAFGSAMTIATLAAMTACGSSGSKPDTQAAPTQPAATQASTTSATSTKEFVSDYYDFAVTLPQTWAEVDATIDWDGQHLSGPGSLQFANFPEFTTDRTLMAASATEPTGTQLADWQAAMARGTPSECSSTSSPERTTIGGEPALLWTVKCSDGLDAIHLVALHGDRGYVVYMGSATANDDAEDRQIFEKIRQSFRFTS